MNFLHGFIANATLWHIDDAFECQIVCGLIDDAQIGDCVAYFRALRYRLSRTYWRGIRGGSDDPGFQYGLSYMWKWVVGWLPLFLMVPWAMISLWNDRWNAMSFGPHRFSANAQWTPLMKRYLLFYLVPFLFFGGAVIFGISMAASGGTPTCSAAS